jgi:hypothetical protein
MGLPPTRTNENPLASARRGTPWRAPTMAGKGDFQESREAEPGSQAVGCRRFVTLRLSTLDFWT